MNNFFRTIIAAWGAKKLGGGCLSTIVIFIIIYTLLGKCGNQTGHAPAASIPSKSSTVCKQQSKVNDKAGNRVAFK